MRRLACRSLSTGGGGAYSKAAYANTDIDIVSNTDRGIWVARTGNPFAVRLAILVDYVGVFLRPLVNTLGLPTVSKHEKWFSSQVESALEDTPYQKRVKIIPRIREGGAFAYFPDSTMREGALIEIEKSVDTLQCYKVVGVPFLEDLLKTNPSRVLSITRTDNGKMAATQQQLFEALRPYGRIASMEQTSDKSWTVKFTTKNSAVAARSCVANLAVNGDKLAFQYESTHWIWLQKLISNPRLFIPILAVLGTVGTVLLIDPLRYMNMARKLSAVERSTDTHSWDLLEQTSFEKKLMSVLGTPPVKTTTIGLHGPSDTVDIVLNKVTRARPFVITLDLESLADGNLTQFVEELSTQVGFTPSFQRLQSFFGWIQGMVPGLKVPDVEKGNQVAMDQMRRIMTMSKQIITIVSSTYPKNGGGYPYATILVKLPASLDKESRKVCEFIVGLGSNLDAHVLFIADSQRSIRALTGADGPREFLECKDLELEEVQSLMTKSLETDTSGKVRAVPHETTSSLWNSLTEALFNQVRKVVLIGKNTWKNETYEPVEQVFEDFDAQEDCFTEESRKNIQQIAQRCFEVVGGRLSDVSEFMMQLQDGGDVEEVLGNMVAKTREQFLRESFSGSLKLATKCDSWTLEQIWLVTQNLKDGPLPLDKILYGVLKGDTEALNAFIQKGIVQIQDETATTSELQLGSPLLRQAVLTLSPLLHARMQKLINEKDMLELEEKIEHVEKEQQLGNFNPERWQQLRAEMRSLSRQADLIKAKM